METGLLGVAFDARPGDLALLAFFRLRALVSRDHKFSGADG